MAEGGHVSSPRDGSDADYELCCTPCNEDNVREEAIKYCSECQEYLCLTCTRHHGRQKATRSHQLVDKDNAKPAGDTSVCKDVIKSKCRYHPDRDIEIYCGSHDMVYCAFCVAIEHRSCSEVRKIDSVTISECNGNVGALLAEIKDVNEQLKVAARKKEDNLRCMNEQKKTIQTCIQEAKRKLMEQLDVLERKSESFHEKHSAIKNGFESDINMLKIKISEVEKMIRNLESISKTDAELPEHTFVQTKLSKKTVAEAAQVLAESTSNGTKEMIFEEYEAFISSNLETFGNIKRLTSSGNVYMKVKPLKMESKSNISVRMQTDRNLCDISDICQLDNGTIVLADYSNTRLKLLDTNYNLKADCNVEKCPLGVCCTKKNEVAVKLPCKILFISVGSKLYKLREIKVSSGMYYGLAYHAGKLWQSAGKRVGNYYLDGKLLKFIKTDLSGYKIFKSSTQNMTISGESVIIADWSDGVVCFGSEGTVKKELRNERLTKSCGVCVTDDGVVLVAGYGSNNIVMFQENGKCLGELVSEDVGVNRPVSLCYIKNTNSVIVACEDSDSLYLLQLSR